MTIMEGRKLQLDTEPILDMQQYLLIIFKRISDNCILLPCHVLFQSESTLVCQD